MLPNGPEPEFLFQALAFEVFLARSALAIHNQQEPAKPDFPVPGLNRLATLLLTIRQQARRHLGVQRLRDRQWLEEYYFLLTCYGIYAGLFDNYQTNRRQLAAAYISAGVAARQLSLPTFGLSDAIRDFEQRAQAIMASPQAGFDPEKHSVDRVAGEYCYHPRLAFGASGCARRTAVTSSAPSICWRTCGGTTLTFSKSKMSWRWSIWKSTCTPLSMGSGTRWNDAITY